jgi:dTDP-4-dehydrorhamnose reductase
LKIAITGAGGQLGTDLTKAIAESGLEYYPLKHEELDVTDVESIRAAMERIKPDAVINTAAFHKVDLCEDEPEQTMLVNSVGARNVAVACREVGATAVYISTDYVFDGEKGAPYVETDTPIPLSVYGAAKLAAEHMTRLSLERHFVIRTTGLYGIAGYTGKGGNFVETVLKFVEGGKPMNVVADQFVTPTSTSDLAPKIVELIRTDNYGLYHMTNTDHCSWYEFALEVAKLSGLSGDIGRTTSAKFSAKAQRPPYSVLDNRHLRDVGLSDMRPWREALADYMGIRMGM